MTTLSKKLLLLTLAFLITGVTFSQKIRKTAKANKEFALYSYIDAREIYEELLEDYEKRGKSGTVEIYQRLGDTYYLNSEYSKAVDKYEKIIELYPADMAPIYYFRLSQSLKSRGGPGDVDEAKRILEGVDLSSIIITPLDTEFNDETYKKTQRFLVDPVSINNKAASDFGTSYYQDKIVYSGVSKMGEGVNIDDWTGQPFLDLYVAEVNEEGDLIHSDPIPGDINTRYHESSAAFTEDGNTVYFTRNNYMAGKTAKDRRHTIKLKLYKASREGNNWTNVIELPMTDSLHTSINSNDWSTAHPALSVDNKRLYFASDRPFSKSIPPKTDKRGRKKDSLVQSDIWYVDILGDNTYSNPKQVDSINTIYKETFPFISSAGELYYSSDAPGGEGGLDVYKAKLDAKGQPTGVVARFGKKVNSNQDDFGFIWNDDKKTGYFSSNRGGSEGSVSDDIYRVVEECIITLKGVVTDFDTKKPIPGAQVVLLDGQNNNNPVGEPITVGADGAYSFEVECCKEYTVGASKEKDVNRPECYISSKRTFKDTSCDKSRVIDLPLPLKLDPCCGEDLGACLCIPSIYFTFDRFNIREDAEIELNKILKAMQKDENLKVRIESHTDSRGSDAYNVDLSAKRAQSTLEWLVEKKISPSRLSAQGFGETQLLDRCTYLDECGKELQIPGCTLDQFTESTQKCTNGVKCSDEEHQTNRRSKFIIVSK